MKVTIKQDDSGFDYISHSFKPGRPLYLEGATVRFMMGTNNYERKLIDAPAYFLSKTDMEAVLEYKFSKRDTFYPGQYIGMFIITWPDGKQKTLPTNGSIPIEVQRTIAGGTPVFPDRVVVTPSMSFIKKGD